jgi:hypothetical protein
LEHFLPKLIFDDSINFQEKRSGSRKKFCGFGKNGSNLHLVDVVVVWSIVEKRAMLMNWGITIADFTALLMVAFTFVTTVANILLWVSTRRTVTILLEQVRHQIASGYSQAQHSVVDAHRDLFFGILNSPTLLEAFTKANGLDPKAWELQKVSEFLINQVLIGGYQR